MSGNHRNKTPVYQRIQNTIRKRIEAAQLTPGDAVPSERELAKTHEVSLMTARHALAGLEREGIVERRRGAGTFVAMPKIHFNKLMSYTEHMSSRGLVPRSRVLLAKVIEHEQEVAARLGLPASSHPVKIERLRLTGEEPFASGDLLPAGRRFLWFGDRAPWEEALYSRPWSTTTEWNWPTPMKKLTRRRPMRILPDC
jgi:GntR family transcriptional regulator